MTTYIDRNVNGFLAGRTEGSRYTSFDYCFNYFQDAHDGGKTASLAAGDKLQQSCLQLGFYLASWGMMRGGSDFGQASVRQLIPVVRQIAAEPRSTWELDVPVYQAEADHVLDLARRIRSAYGFVPTDTLVTKTMLGVFGCIPAFDRYFRAGSGCYTLSQGSLRLIADYYERDRESFDAHKIYTLDFATGHATRRRYPTAKLIDMIFFQAGLLRQRRRLR